MDVAELTEAFKEHGTGNQAQLMQRVQELMGQGVDVSSLFPSMVSVSQRWFFALSCPGRTRRVFVDV